MGYDYSYHFCNLQQSGYSEHLESLDHMDMHRKTMPTCEPSGVGSHVKLPKLCQVCVVSWRWKNAIALSTNSKAKVDSIWYHVYIYDILWYIIWYTMIHYDTLRGLWWKKHRQPHLAPSREDSRGFMKAHLPRTAITSGDREKTLAPSGWIYRSIQ